MLFKLKQNIKFNKLDRRVNETVERIIKQTEIDTTVYSRIIDENFDLIWNSSQPQCKVFCDLYELDAENEFLLHCH